MTITSIFSAAPLFPRKLLGFVADDRNLPGWQKTAEGWLFLALGCSILLAFLIFFFKWFWEYRKEKEERREIDMKGGFRSFVCLAAGSVIFGVVLFSLFRANLNWKNVIGIGGMGKSYVMGLVLYLILAFVMLKLKWPKHKPWNL